MLIIDDNSSDNTEKKAKQTFRKAKFSQFKIIKGKKLPINWSGKVWALKQGVDAAIKKKFSHFVFIDADIILKDKVIGKTLNFMTERKLSMLSLMAKLRCVTFWENLLIPSFIYFFFKNYIPLARSTTTTIMLLLLLEDLLCARQNYSKK